MLLYKCYSLMSFLLFVTKNTQPFNERHKKNKNKKINRLPNDRLTRTVTMGLLLCTLSHVCCHLHNSLGVGGWSWGEVHCWWSERSPAMFWSVPKTLVCSSPLVNCAMKSKRFWDKEVQINEKKKPTRKTNKKKKTCWYEFHIVPCMNTHPHTHRHTHTHIYMVKRFLLVSAGKRLMKQCRAPSDLQTSASVSAEREVPCRCLLLRFLLVNKVLTGT